MNEQSMPFGQHIADTTLVTLTRVQEVSFGQQNSDGKSFPHCKSAVFPPQVASCREKRLDAPVPVIAEKIR